MEKAILVVFVVLAVAVFLSMWHAMLTVASRESRAEEMQDARPEIVPTRDNRCVFCGEIIPEGRQVCPNCERMVEDGK